MVNPIERGTATPTKLNVRPAKTKVSGPDEVFDSRSLDTLCSIHGLSEHRIQNTLWLVLLRFPHAVLLGCVEHCLK